jgi:hypothetical protein
VELGGALRHAAVELGGPLERAEQVRTHRLLGRGVGRTEHDESVRTEQVGHGLREGPREVLLLAVVPLYPLCHVAAELRIGRGSKHGVDDASDLGAQRLLVERTQRCLGRAGAQLYPLHLIGSGLLVEMIRLQEVVIVAGHPKQRHDGSAQALLEATRDRDRRERFVDREQRASEQAGLLSRGDAESPLGKQTLQVVGAGGARDARLPQPGVRRYAACGRECLGVQRRGGRGRRGLQCEAHDRWAIRITRAASGATAAPV